jgi:uncharacterized membrane protein YphA (DoxX/SURF4 family)
LFPFYREDIGMHYLSAEAGLMKPTGITCGCDLSLTKRILSWICRLGVAAILAQTLFFKFTYAPETQAIFGPLGGRPAATLVGLMELAAVVLLLIPKTVVWGALVALLTITGAILSHLTWLGIVVNEDGGLLFGLALAIALGSCVILFIHGKSLIQRITSDWKRAKSS